MAGVLATVIGYLLGSFDFAVMASRLRGIDIYQVGSGNPGTANVLRTQGWKVAAPVMLGDMAKGAAAAVIGSTMAGEVAGYAAAFAAVVGHCFPVWHRFRGGKGVATALGAILWLEPWVGLGMAAVWLAALVLGRISSVGSLLAVVGMVPALVILDVPGAPVGWATAMAVLIVMRHRENIGRLLAGDERRAATDPDQGSEATQ